MDSAAEVGILMPASTAGRLLTGSAAVLLPSPIAQGVGLEMGGGRGFWWFSDLDTLVFDAVLIIAIVFTFRAARWSTLRNPVFWFVLVLSSVIFPMAYTVTNYGTLFRLRAMLYVSVALIPLAIAVGRANEGKPAARKSVPAPEGLPLKSQ